jgi:hypothetical protein
MNKRLQTTLSVVVVLGLAACAESAPAGGKAAAGTPPVAAPVAPTIVTAFDPAAGELPEGVATRDGFAYVGFAPLGEIAKVDLKTGTRTRFAKLPKPVPN